MSFPIEALRLRNPSDAGTLTLADYGAVDDVVDPANADASFTLQADGGTAGLSIPEGATGNDWRTGGSGADYEVRLSVVSQAINNGTFSGPALNVWHSLSIDRTWHLTRTIINTNSFTGKLEFRAAGGSTVLGECYLSLTAIVEP